MKTLPVHVNVHVHVPPGNEGQARSEEETYLNSNHNNGDCDGDCDGDADASPMTKKWPSLPMWATERRSWGKRLRIGEWEGCDVGKDNDDNDIDDDDDDEHHHCSNGIGDDEAQIVDQYRQENGWKGSDLVHSETSPVRILEYRVKYPIHNPEGRRRGQGDDAVTLTGLVHFTHRAESHRGFCHGGSMCSIMDDIIGWTGFCVTGDCKPWTGFTVQVNTSLVKPVPVGHVLKIRGMIEKVERRKVYVRAQLVDLNEHGEEIVHATGDGLVIVNRGVMDGH